MRGDNPIRKQELVPDGSLFVENVWYTIQGEGPFSGVPAVFVRLSGCWLACYWCDTAFEEFAYNMAPAKLLDAVWTQHQRYQGHDAVLIVLTGGDPLRQNIVPFCQLALDEGYLIQIETAGIKWVPGLERLTNDLRCTVVVSPKTGHVCDEVRQHAQAWKYVLDIDDRLGDDGLPNSSTQVEGLVQPLARPPSSVPPDNIYVQPRDRGDSAHNLLNMAKAATIAMRHGYRLSLQTHKIVGLE